MSKILETVEFISQPPTKKLIVLTALASMGFSYMTKTISGNKEK